MKTPAQSNDLKDGGAEIIIGKLDGSKATVTYWKESSFSFLIVKKDGESEITVSNYKKPLLNNLTNMKKYIAIVAFICVLSFLAGMLKGQYDRAHYFDEYPSPLMCHAENNCKL